MWCPSRVSPARRAARVGAGCATSACCSASRRVDGPHLRLVRAALEVRLEQLADARRDTSLESGLRPPCQRGTVAAPGFAGRTSAVMFSTRISSSACPPKTKASPGESQAMNDSSTLPSRLPLQEAHVHRGVRHDRADRHAVAPRDRRVPHHVPAVHLLDAPVLGVGLQRLAAARDEVEGPAPLGVGEVAEGARRTSPRPSCASSTKPSPAAMVTRCCVRRSSGLSTGRRDSMRRASAARRAAAASTNSSACEGTQLTRLTCPGRVARAAGALQQPRDALGTADLQHALHRGEVHAQVEARGRDDRLQPPLLQPLLHPAAHVGVERAVVQGRRAPPTPASPRGAPGTRSPPASACW